MAQKKRDTDKHPSDSTKQLSLRQAFKKDRIQKKETTTAIAYYIIKDVAPIARVEHCGLKHLVKTFDKRNAVPM